MTEKEMIGDAGKLRRYLATISLLLFLELLRRWRDTRPDPQPTEIEKNGSGQLKRGSSTSDHDKRREALLKEYSEVSNNFRTLTDVRFKVLGVLPIASGAAATLVASTSASSSLKFSLALFGLAVIVGLITYNARNNQLYNELVGRAGWIERSVGLPDGAFSNRPRSWLSLKFGRLRWQVDHGTGIAIIYVASAALLLTVVLSQVLEFFARQRHVNNLLRPVQKDLLFYFPNADAALWFQLVALGLSIITTTALLKSVKHQRNCRQRNMRASAAEAVKWANAIINRGATFDRSSVVHFNQFSLTCSKLSGDNPETISKRAHFYLSNPATRNAYARSESDEHAAAQLVADLTDLPPGWLYDCATNRRGLL